MLKIIAFGLIAHLFFLASIFQIYFQSPIIVGLTPQSDIDDSPAKRLILFVADGLRAESFYRDNLKLTPFLRDIILNHGLHGISHTRVPTESRPGHVALIAGFYEDPSAVLKGWQDNPVDFDSVFNRSRLTYAWGSPDILSVFTKHNIDNHIVADAYPAENEVFSGKINTTLLDTWVFDKASDFLRKNKDLLAEKDHAIFFLHLLGLDTAGHVHKPNTDLFDNNLHAVDAGVRHTVDLVNAIFRDDKTTFVFTSDHGMTNKGGHGAGTADETETPIVAWGAGISRWRNLVGQKKRPVSVINSIEVPRYDISQADIAPLISSLIGSAVPVNNIGKLPDIYLNVSKEYKLKCVMNNAMQIANQFKYLQSHYRKSAFFKDFHDLNEKNLLSLEYEIQTALKSGSLDRAIDLYKHYIDLALDGIRYFQTYHQNLLLFSVSLAMIGWIFFLHQQLNVNGANTPEHKRRDEKRTTHFLYLCIAFIVLSLFIYVQNLTLAMGAFILLPVFCWYPVRTVNMLEQLRRLETWILIAGIELLVLSFFYRKVLSVLLAGLCVYEYVILKDKKEKFDAYSKWALNCAILAVYPSLPLVDKDSNNITFLLIGLAAWYLKIFYAIKLGMNTFKVVNLIVYAVAAINYLLIIFDLNDRMGLSELKQFISWIVLVFSFIMPTLSPNSFRDRLTAILSSLCIPYILMSLSYEPLFFMTFASTIYYWVSMIYTDRKQLYSVSQLENVEKIREVEDVDFKRGFVSILYVLVSFFGTGNIASVSSFDPNWVRCFVSTFSPFLMASLIIIKLLIPVLLVMCAVRLIHLITRLPLEKFFIIILLCCNLMCLNFLFLVKNTGSWLEIGTSISHFVIMEITVLVLCLLQLIAKFLTQEQLMSLLKYGKTRDLSYDQVKFE